MWDLFICHASEDKDAVARPLAEQLQELGLEVWYDEFSLFLGDSLRQKIDVGLAKSKFGIVILSPDFFKKDWPQIELDGLLAREIDGAKVILPVWHNIERNEVNEYSPILAGRVAAKTANGLDNVVREIMKVIEPTKHNENDGKPVSGNTLEYLQNEEQEIQPAKQPKEEIHVITKSRKKNKRATIIEVVEYAHDLLRGMGLSSSGAREFGELWMDKYSDCDFDLFKRVFEYANDALGGMGKPSLPAREFGLLWVRKYSDCDFYEFKRDFDYAYDTLEGKGLSSRDAEEYALERLLKSQKQMPPISSPSPVISFSGSGRVNSPPFTMDTSPWILQFSTNWSGHFAVQLRDGRSVGLVINQSVSAGQKYETYVYEHTSNNMYFFIQQARGDGEWTLSVISK